jgi:hypothetical protein
MRPLLAAVALAASPVAVPAQAVHTVVVEQRVLMTDRLSTAAARRQAREEAIAEAVRRVAGVRVRSSVWSTSREDRTGVFDEYRSLVQLDATGRAVDVQLRGETWETGRTAADPLYYTAQYAVTVQQEQGAPDESFAIEARLPATEFLARGSSLAASDELVLHVRSTKSAQLFTFSIIDDSASLLLPNTYISTVVVDAHQPAEVPSELWRERGLRLRVTLPRGVDEQGELIAVIAVIGDVGPPPVSGTVTDLQRWLVSIPPARRAEAWVPFRVRRQR